MRQTSLSKSVYDNLVVMEVVYLYYITFIFCLCFCIHHFCHQSIVEGVKYEVGCPETKNKFETTRYRLTSPFLDDFGEEAMNRSNFI